MTTDDIGRLAYLSLLLLVLSIWLFAANRSRLTQSLQQMAIWILIFAELFEFGLFFVLYVIAKAHHPELFSAGPPQLAPSGSQK